MTATAPGALRGPQRHACRPPARPASARARRAPDPSRGQALIAALLLLTLLAAGGLLAGGELRARAHALAHARSVDALATARAA
ncbi:MAG: hypothetical protein KA733_02280, partial [Thauera sp.]|nr:hypothetical protein [Thauera sp.]